MTTQVAIRIADHDLAIIDEAVAAGRFPNRTAAIREAVRLIASEQRDRNLADEYRRAYAKHSQKDWIGEASAAAAGEVVAGTRVSSDE